MRVAQPAVVDAQIDMSAPVGAYIEIPGALSSSERVNIVGSSCVGDFPPSVCTYSFMPASALTLGPHPGDRDSLYGRVTDSSGRPVRRARVVASSRDTATPIADAARSLRRAPNPISRPAPLVSYGDDPHDVSQITVGECEREYSTLALEASPTFSEDLVGRNTRGILLDPALDLVSPGCGRVRIDVFALEALEQGLGRRRTLLRRQLQQLFQMLT